MYHTLAVAVFSVVTTAETSASRDTDAQAHATNGAGKFVLITRARSLVLHRATPAFKNVHGNALTRSAPQLVEWRVHDSHAIKNVSTLYLVGTLVLQFAENLAQAKLVVYVRARIRSTPSLTLLCTLPSETWKMTTPWTR